jgi:hypothetical protein
MKRKLIVLLSIIGLIIFLFFYLKSDNYLSNNEFKIINTEKFQNGDLIFHISKSEQSEAIQLATKSEYSHCGLIYKKENDFFVVEAIQPVRLTPLDEWIARGEKGHYVVKRLKHADQILTPDILKNMKIEGEKFIGKNYDFNFNWNDDKIYCSELVWKIYKRATGIEIGKLEKLGDFDLTNNNVKTILEKRYGKNIPINEIVISPASIFNCNLLYTVKEN